MTPINRISDKVAPLNFDLFKGNPFKQVFVFPGTFVMPTVVDIKAFTAPDSPRLATALQPTISMAGHELTITYPSTATFPATAWQEVFFDGVRVWAGNVTCTKNTTLPTGIRSGAVLIVTPESGLILVPYTADYLTIQARNDAVAAAAYVTSVVAITGVRKTFFDQPSVAHNHSFAHNFRSTFGVLASTYRLRLRVYDANGFELAGVRVVADTDNSCRVLYDDATALVTGDFVFFTDPYPV